jgi:hypothetical protein
MKTLKELLKNRERLKPKDWEGAQVEVAWRRRPRGLGAIVPEVLMRAVSMPSILAAAILVGATTVHAQTYDPRYPVCMKVYSGGPGGGGWWIDCSFTSLPQCRASASGRAAMCEINPYFALAQKSPAGPYRW